MFQEKYQSHLFELWGSAMISGFCGVLIGLVALHVAMEVSLVMFGSGMAGGIGWQTVGWLFTLAKKRAAGADRSTSSSSSFHQ